jgi:hypothetical protein
MANSKNQLPGLKSPASTKTKVPGIGALTSLESTPATGTFRPGRSRDTSLSSLTGKINATGLRFGSPSSSATATSSSSGSQWTNLLTQTARGGVSSALGGGLKDIGGIASIVSGFIGLFGGGKSAPPPLVRFEAPASQNQTAFVGSTTGPARWLDSGAAHSASSKGIYATGSESNVQSLQYQSSQIAQAVKQALLNSSSLNDVIAEI